MVQNDEFLIIVELLGKYTEPDFELSIATDQIVNVIITRCPKGFQYTRGLVKNALLIKVYDTDTGDFLGSSLKHLDQDKIGTILTIGQHIFLNASHRDRPKRYFGKIRHQTVYPQNTG